MGRRLLTLVGMALAVGLGAPPALVGQEPAPVPEADAPAELDLPKGDVPPLDPQLKQSQAPAGAVPNAADPDRNPLPPAQEPAAQPAPTQPAAGAKPEGGLYVLPPDRLQHGKQSIGLSVEVQSPPFLNINQDATLKVIVKNTGSTDALGVEVRDELPPTLTFLNSQPVSQNTPGDPLLVWKLGTVAKGTERVILVRVKPTKVGPFDHAATVTMEAGSKSRTLVREPKLKVEQTVSSAKVNKGQPVEFKIVVQNIGDGPARNVIVQAKLTNGLRHESGDSDGQGLFERPLDQPLQPNERVVLEPFVADAILGGEQSFSVEAKSPDVNPGAEEARSTQAVLVVEPKLKMTVAGPAEKYTDTNAKYEISLENPGTATARKVKVVATLPIGGTLRAVPPGAQYDANTRRLVWSLPQLDPKEPTKLPFEVRVGGVGVYQVAVEARAEGGLSDQKVQQTNVKGIAFLDCVVTEHKRVIDEGDETVFHVKLTNSGTKEATHLLIKAEFSDNVRPTNIDLQGHGEARFDKVHRLLVFPMIDRLGNGKSLDIGIKVKATKAGKAVCRVNVVHDEDSDAEKFDAMATLRVTPGLR